MYLFAVSGLAAEQSVQMYQKNPFVKFTIKLKLAFLLFFLYIVLFNSDTLENIVEVLLQRSEEKMEKQTETEQRHQQCVTKLQYIQCAIKQQCVALKSTYSLNNIKLLLKTVLAMFMLVYNTMILL